MIFFYIFYWFLTQRLSLRYSLLVVASVEVSRIVFSGVLRSSIDPMFDDSHFFEMLAFNLGIFVPLAIVFVCVVHFSGKLLKKWRSKKKIEQASELAKRVDAVPLAVEVVPNVQPIVSESEPEHKITHQKVSEPSETMRAPRKLDGIMRLRIVATILIFLGCAGFATMAVGEYASYSYEADQSFGRKVQLMRDFEENSELQEQCATDDAFFEENPPSHLKDNTTGKSWRASWEASEQLKRSLESIESALFTCGLKTGYVEDCEAYRLFDDLYKSCKRRNREQDRKAAEQKSKCASLEEQKATIVAQLDLDDRYFEHLSRCDSPYDEVNDAFERKELADRELRDQIVLGVVLVFGGPGLFWGMGSVIGWIVRGFRQ
ncbi:AAA family ATPase [Hyphomonas atlantica corrig.]|uniref:hypothetical protein n=1 Tax=Hyphomonas atlantica TaxID=1280948 RepID=UPI002351FFE4|nr:hypothetical protein [Hyphomonas atlantica]